MAVEYTLYYWPIPFRGHFVRYLLAHVGATWEEPGAEAVARLKTLPVSDQPVPFMAPPMLHDLGLDARVAQTPVILAYLGRKHDLIPGDPIAEALALKTVADSNDVLEEVTCNCGARMWSQEAWEAFAGTRLPRWMAIFEETGRRNGLTAAEGYILGTSHPTLADLATAALWFTLIDKLPPLATELERHAPVTSALSRRIAGSPAIAEMRRDCDARWGNAYCGGEIERSLRRVLGC